jgi:hypothetical protein
MAILKLDPKRRIRQEFLHDTGKFERIFLGHDFSIVDRPASSRNVAYMILFAPFFKGFISAAVQP